MKKILFAFLIQLFSIITLQAQDIVEFDYELDAYYSNVSAFIDLDRDANITDGSSMSERQLYQRLLLNSLTPNIFLMEFSLHPMSIGGLYYRDNNENLYTESKLKKFHLVKSLTAGFDEPYSISMFLGHMIVFTKKNSTRAGNNRAYTGVLLTVGDKTIKDNKAHLDTWVNIEFKLKGTRDKKNADLDWSFRFGSRMHTEKDFADSIYIGARRKSIDYDKSIFSIVYNSAFSTMFAVSADTFEIIEGEAMVEKVYPSSIEGLSISLGIGYIYISDDKYLGILRDEGVDNHQLILRPNLKYKF